MIIYASTFFSALWMKSSRMIRRILPQGTARFLLHALNVECEHHVSLKHLSLLIWNNDLRRTVLKQDADSFSNNPRYYLAESRRIDDQDSHSGDYRTCGIQLNHLEYSHDEEFARACEQSKICVYRCVFHLLHILLLRVSRIHSALLFRSISNTNRFFERAQKRAVTISVLLHKNLVGFFQTFRAPFSVNGLGSIRGSNRAIDPFFLAA